MAKNSGSSENINFMTDQNTKLNREIVHSWWTYSLLAWSVNWVHEKSRVFKVNRTYISLTKCTRGSEMIQDSIQQNNFSSVPKSEKRKSWLLTTLQHFSEGLQRYLGSWCKSLFTIHLPYQDTVLRLTRLPLHKHMWTASKAWLYSI